MADSQSGSPMNEDSSHQAEHYFTFGRQLLELYAGSENPKEMSDAVTALATAVKLTPIDSPARPERLVYLGRALLAQYQQQGPQQKPYLDRAIDAFAGAILIAAAIEGDLDEVLAKLRAGSSVRPLGASSSLVLAEYLTLLGEALLIRFFHAQKAADPWDLDTAVEALTAVMNFLPGPAGRVAAQALLAKALLTRFHQIGRPNDLDASIALYTDLAASVEPHSTEYLGYIEHLSLALRGRYNRTGSRSDLHQAEVYDRLVSDARMGSLPPDRPVPNAQLPRYRYRLDAAAPDQTVVNQPFDLAVAVRRAESLPLQVDDLVRTRSGEAQIVWPKGASRVTLRVHLHAPACHIFGQSSQWIPLQQGLDSPTVFFTLQARRPGPIWLRVTVYQSVMTLGSVRLSMPAMESVVGAVAMQVSSGLLDDRGTPEPSGVVRLLRLAFSLDELRDVCFSLGIDFDDLPGEGVRRKSLELVLYCRRRGRLEELMEHVMTARPNWLDLIEEGA